MATYNPPTENLPIFDPVVFLSGDEALTTNEADKRYLKFPSAQGTENLQAINVNGIAQFNTNVGIGSSGTLNNTPTLTTNKTNLVIGTGGSGQMDIQCPVNVGGFGSINMITAPLNLSGGANIQQTGNPITNTLCGTNFTKPLTLNGTLNSDRIINNVFYQLRDANSLTTTTGQIYSASGVFNYDNDANGGTHNFATNTTGGVQTIPLQFNSNDMVIATTNPPTCSASSAIATTDNSNKIPSTAWVKSVLPVVPPSTSTLAYYRTGLIAGNQKPLTTPLVISVNTGSQTGTGITMCPLVFRMTCSYTNGTTPANQLDSGNVSTFCNTVSCIFNYFVYNSQPVVSGTNANYFNNAMSSSTANTAYYNNVVYGTTYGRPFWTTNLSNEANVSVIFPFTFTGTPFLNGVKTIVFDPPAVGYPANSSFYWEWTIEVLNRANFAGMITSTGFNVNLNC